MFFFYGILIIFVLFVSIYLFNPRKKKKKFSLSIFFLLTSSLIIYEITGNKSSLTFTEDLDTQISNMENLDPQKVVLFLEKKLKKKPHDLKGWLILARTCLLTGHIQKADLYYKKGMHFFPKNEEIIFEYAILKKNNNQFLSAINFLEKIKTINPENLEARQTLIETLITLDQIDRAKLEILEIKNSMKIDENWLKKTIDELKSR